MKFSELTEQQILNFFETAPIQDFNLLYKFYTTYKPILQALTEAYSGYAYQSDLFKIYEAFYNVENANYSTFSRHLTEMTKANLIGSTKGNPKIIFMKSKGYTLLGKNQATIHNSRFNNRAMHKSTLLTQLHLTLKLSLGGKYHPTWLKRDPSNNCVYTITTKSDKQHFFICVKEKQSSKDLTEEASAFIDSLDFTTEISHHFFLTVDEHAKRYNTVVENLRHTASFNYNQAINKLVIKSPWSLDLYDN